MNDGLQPYNRRTVLRALAGVAGLPFVSFAEAPKRKVGIVGAGMAGVSLAWLLDGRRDVVLLESAPAIGGNVQSLAIELDGHTFSVDVGAQYFNPNLYPTYVKLLAIMGLLGEVHSFATSITLDMAGEPLPRFISPLLPGRTWPLFVPWNRAGLQAFAVAFASAKKRQEQEPNWDLTMEAWLSSLELSRSQWEGMVLPWTASLFTGSIDQARAFSARAAMIFAASALPENPTDPILYYVLKPGMAEVLRRLAASFSTVQVLTGARVTNLVRPALGGFDIQTATGQTIHVDDLVFASSGPATLNLLGTLPGTSTQQAALQGIEFADAQLVIHTDPIYAPGNQEYWSFFNAEIQGGYCEASMWLADVLATVPRQTAAKVWKSWVLHRSHQPTQVLAQSQYRHMVPTPATIHAQRDLRGLQGQGGLWFAGGYTRPFDSQETALVSAIDVAQSLLNLPS